MSRAAGSIFAATDGMGTNEEAIHAALRGKSPAEIAVLREEYQNHYGTSLDSVLADELSDEDLASARAAMTADPVQAAAATLVRASSGVGTDEEAITATLRGIADPAQRAAVAAEYERVSGQSLSAMLSDEMGGTDAEVATALAAGRTEEADAVLLEESMSGGMLGLGVGTDEEGINAVLERCTDQAQRDRVAAAYEARTGRTLGADMADEMGGTDLDLSSAILTGDQAGAAAVRIQAAASGLGTDEDAIFQQLAVANPAQRQAIVESYNARFGATSGGTNLDTMLTEELGDMDHERATQLAANGELDPVFAMRYAMDGVGTDEEMMRGALGNLTPAQATQLQTDYQTRYGLDLRTQMGTELSGRDEFYIGQSLAGERGLSVDDRLARADASHDFERGSGAGVFGGFTDVFFEAGEQLDNQHARLGALRESRDTAATPAARAAAEREMERVLGYQSQDVEAYHAAQDTVTNAAATTAAVVATVAVTAATGGLGAGVAVPALASFMGTTAAATGIGATSLAFGAGALAGGLTSMAVKRSISGAAYGDEAAGLDLAMTGVNALTAGAMASGAAVQGLPQLLASRGVGTFGASGGSFANTMATQLVQGAGQGLVSGTAQGLLDEQTWRGPGNGFGNFLGVVGSNMVSNMAGGAAQTVAGSALSSVDLFDPNTVRGSFSTGAIGGVAGGVAQTALTPGAFEGRWEDIALRFGNNAGMGGLQGGLMNAGQTVSAQRLEAQAMRLAEAQTAAAPAAAEPAAVVNPADQVPNEVLATLPEEVAAVVKQAKETPPGTAAAPREPVSATNPADVAALGPEVAQTVEAARPVIAATENAPAAPAATETAAPAPRLTPEELFAQAHTAERSKGDAAISSSLSERIPEVLEAQIAARTGANPELQGQRSTFETALGNSPEANGAVAPTLDRMAEKAFDYIASTRSTPETQIAAMSALGMAPSSGLAGAVGTDPNMMLDVLASGNSRERGIALARFQEMLGNDALAPGGIERMRATFENAPVEGAGFFGMADVERLAARVEALDATGATGKGRSPKALFSDTTGHAPYAEVKGSGMDAKMPALQAEAVSTQLGRPVTGDPATGFVPGAEQSPLARTTMTVDQAQAAGYNLSPREIATASETGVLPWNRGDVANIVNPANPFIADANAASMPQKAGVSGTTFRLMGTGDVLGADPAMTRLAAMTSLIPIDAHSMHEIAFAANGFQSPAMSYDPTGMPYTPSSTGLTPEILQAIARRAGLDLDQLNMTQSTPANGSSETPPGQ